MSVYVASSLANAARVRKLIAAIKERGYHITYDWTGHNGDGDPSIPDSQPDVKARVAESELAGVIAASVILVVMPGGRGTHFEFGVAYTLRKPIVLLLDEHDGPSPAFHFLSGIVRCHTEVEALAAVVDFLECRRQVDVAVHPVNLSANCAAEDQLLREAGLEPEEYR